MKNRSLSPFIDNAKLTFMGKQKKLINPTKGNSPGFRIASLWSSRKSILILIFITALIPRMIYITEISSSSPYFHHPVVDAGAYYSAAVYINKTGDWLGEGHVFKLRENSRIPESLINPERAYWVERPYWQPPFYFYWLAFIFKIFGPSIWAALSIQAVLAALSAVFLYSLCLYFFSHRTGLIVVILYALYGPLIYFTGELLVPALFIFLILLMFYYFLVAMETFRLRHWILFGMLFGIAMITRPTILVFLPVVIFWIIYAKRVEIRGSLITSTIVVMLAVVFLFPLATFIRNSSVTGENVMISTNSGINFYIGNNAAWKETYTIRPGYDWNKLTHEPLQADASWTTSQKQQNNYFLNKGLDWMISNPGHFILHSLEKAYLHLHGYELIRNVDIYHLSQYSVLLSLLLWKVPFFYFPFGVIAPFFLAGMFFLFGSRWKKYFPLTAFLIVMSAVIILFFPTSRYRVQIIPFILMVSVYGLERLIQLFKSRKMQGAGLAGLTLIFMAALNLPGPVSIFHNPEFRAANHYLEGTVAYNEKNYEKAIHLFQKAVDIHPRHEDALTNIGLCYAFLGSDRRAGEFFLQAYHINPDFPKNIFNLGIYYQKTGQWEKALKTFQEYLKKELDLRLSYSLYQQGLRELERCRRQLNLQ